VDHSEGKGGERVMAIPWFQGDSPRVCRLRTASFWPRWSLLLSWLLLYYFNNVVNSLSGVCFMHVIVYGCKPNILS
jgi:hypothetical protein